MWRRGRAGWRLWRWGIVGYPGQQLLNIGNKGLDVGQAYENLVEHLVLLLEPQMQRRFGNERSVMTSGSVATGAALGVHGEGSSQQPAGQEDGEQVWQVLYQGNGAPEENSK